MNNRLSNLRPREVGFLLVGGIVAAALSGTAIAVTSTDFTYATERTGYLSIHPMDLTPAGIFPFTIEYNSARLDVSDGGCASTGINLPQGARVVYLSTYYTASARTATNPNVFLLRNHLITDLTNKLVETNVLETSGARNSVTSFIPFGLSVINNAAYSHGFGICLGQLDSFEGAVLAYRYRTAGD